MVEGKRQKQVAAVLQEEMNTIFRKLNLTMMNGGMISISSVKVTPDLLEARIYISMFQVADTAKTLQQIEAKAWEIKKEITATLGKQLRRVPVIHYYLDDTLDYVFKMEELFKQLNTGDEKK